jgi:hypothetical protein
MDEPTSHSEFTPFEAFFVVVVIVVFIFLAFFRRHSSVLRVTPLKNGMWFVHWWTDESFYWTEKVQCGDTSLQLYSRVHKDEETLYFVDISVSTLSVKENQGNVFSF